MAGKNLTSVQAEHKAFNARDWDTIRGLFADDCVFVDATGVEHKGADAFVNDYAKPWSVGFSDAKVNDGKYYDAGDTVVAEFVGTGVNDGVMAGMPATNRPINIPFCEIYHFGSDGKITSGTAYFDMYAMLVQLGHAQPPG